MSKGVSTVYIPFHKGGLDGRDVTDFNSIKSF
jgi:hypothetical protein